MAGHASYPLAASNASLRKTARPAMCQSGAVAEARSPRASREIIYRKMCPSGCITVAMHATAPLSDFKASRRMIHYESRLILISRHVKWLCGPQLGAVCFCMPYHKLAAAIYDRTSTCP